MLIDLHRKKLIDGITQQRITGEVASDENSYVGTVSNSKKIYILLEKYPEINKPNFFEWSVKHNVQHHIITNGQSVHSKARKLDTQWLAIAKKAF